MGLVVVDLGRDGGEVVVVVVELVGWSSEVGNADTAADPVPPKSGPTRPLIEHLAGGRWRSTSHPELRTVIEANGDGKHYQGREDAPTVVVGCRMAALDSGSRRRR